MVFKYLITFKFIGHGIRTCSERGAKDLLKSLDDIVSSFGDKGFDREIITYY